MDSQNPYQDFEDPRNRAIETYQNNQQKTPAPTNTPPPPNPPPPSNPFNYEAARDAWMSGRYSKDEAGVRQWNDEFGALKDYQGGDTGNLINGGGYIDLLSNWAGGKGNGQGIGSTWTAAGNNGNNPNGGGPAGAPGGGAPGGGTPAAHDPKWDELYNMLMARAKQGTTIDANDPNIRQQVDPYAAAQERSRRNYLADAAESLGPLANLRGEQRVSMERAGQATGQFQGQLIGRELESRRGEIQHALDSMGNMLTEEQRLALQKELGYLNDSTQRYGIDKNYDINNKHVGLGYDELDWRRDPRNPSNYQY